MKGIQGDIKKSKNVWAVSNNIALSEGRGSATAKVVSIVVNHLKTLTDIKHLKNLNETHIKILISYFQDRLEEERDRGLKSSSTATYVSTGLNNIIEYVNKYLKKDDADKLPTIKPSDYGLSAGAPSSKNPTVDINTHELFINYLDEKYTETKDVRYLFLKHSIELARELGLRIREAIAIKILNKDISNGHLKLDKNDLTKNYRERTINLFNQSEKDAIKSAKEAVRYNDSYSLCSQDHIKQQIAFAYNTKVTFEEKYNVEYRFHGERYAFAQGRYLQYLSMGYSANKAKLTLSHDLGHNRIDITERYLRFLT
jgi:hypothetical protein